jgi:hypothetical protein
MNNAPRARINHRHILARLATGPIYDRDGIYWATLKAELARVRAHFADMGLDVILDEPAGYAYLRQQPAEAGDDWNESKFDPIPVVLRRRMLSYLQTILLVLLRERLLHHEQAADIEGPLVLTENDIFEMLRPYLPETSNEKKNRDKVRPLLTRFDELNLLYPVKNRTEPTYRVEQIIKAKLPVEKIAEIRALFAGKEAGAEVPDGEDGGDTGVAG